MSIEFLGEGYIACDICGVEIEAEVFELAYPGAFQVYTADAETAGWEFDEAIAWCPDCKQGVLPL